MEHLLSPTTATRLPPVTKPVTARALCFPVLIRGPMNYVFPIDQRFLGFFGGA